MASLKPHRITQVRAESGSPSEDGLRHRSRAVRRQRRRRLSRFDEVVAQRCRHLPDDTGDLGSTAISHSPYQLRAGRTESARADEILAEGFGRYTMIVCDTGPLVASAISSDDHHRECVDLVTSLHLAGRKILVPGTVAAEVGCLPAGDGGPAAETQFLESLADGTLSPVDLRPGDYPPRR